MIILALDPGTYYSSYVLFNLRDMALIGFNTLSNESLVMKLKGGSSSFDLACGAIERLAIEDIKSYGNPVGDTVLHTCKWIGRFHQAWGPKTVLIPTKTWRTELCHNPRATDGAVRAELINLFAAHIRKTQRSKAPKKDDRKLVIGTRADKGPLYGVRKDEWQALGLAWAMKAWLKKENMEVTKALR